MDSAMLIRTARRRHGLTQAQLAARIGTSQPVISAYEHGTRDPSTGTLRRIVAGTGERLELGLAVRASDASTLPTPQAHAEALVDVLLLADAIPARRPSGRLAFPRIDSGAVSRLGACRRSA
jgi:transcriptional regulator with XRE-family HTH domain